MTARVCLAPSHDGEPVPELDGEWLADLLAFDVTPTAGPVTTAHLQVLVFTVALYAEGARTHGPQQWPTVIVLATLLHTPPEQILYLLTIAVAAGWLIYGDDAPPLPLPAGP